MGNNNSVLNDICINNPLKLDILTPNKSYTLQNNFSKIGKIIVDNNSNIKIIIKINNFKYLFKNCQYSNFPKCVNINFKNYKYFGSLYIRELNNIYKVEFVHYQFGYYNYINVNNNTINCILSE